MLKLILAFIIGCGILYLIIEWQLLSRLVLLKYFHFKARHCKSRDIRIKYYTHLGKINEWLENYGYWEEE